ncbi:MAG TPA: beta-ketoacyl synthase N-terminal-like domain-containing protein [Thermoanaerobaculia bacterium]|nr:beta-ketoacyl synthase N-terminal-like domain-containing protein [Thermoanaerobaculia bacterium]
MSGTDGGRRRVVVTGTGVVSPLGDSAAALHQALAAGTRARKPIELFDGGAIAGAARAGRDDGWEGGGPGSWQGGEIRPFDPQGYVGERNLRPLDRTSRLLVVAAQLALADSAWSADARRAAEVGLVVGTTFCSVRTIAEFDRRALRLGPSHASPLDFANSVINAAAGQAAIWHGLRGVNSTVAGGEASGLLAIAHAAELVRAGRAQALLAGGAEELCFESFFGYARAGRLCGSRRPGEEERPVPFDARRNGFSLAEGAALLVLEDAGAAAARGAAARAEVLGWGTAFAVGADAAGLAAAVGRAVRLALADAGTAPQEIGCLSASASGSREVDRAEALGVAAALGERAATLPVTAIKAMLGEGLGVSGAWQALDLVATIADGVLPGIAGLAEIDPGLPLPGAVAATRQLAAAARRRVLATAIGADGHCAALVLGAPE